MDERHAPPPPPVPARSSLDDVASGQRMLIVAILVNIGAAILSGAGGAGWRIAGPVMVLAAVAAIIGLLRLTSGLGYSAGKQILLFVLAFVPLVSLVMLLVVNGQATKALRAGGYHVGFFGASPKKGSR